MCASRQFLYRQILWPLKKHRLPQPHKLQLSEPITEPLAIVLLIKCQSHLQDEWDRLSFVEPILINTVRLHKNYKLAILRFDNSDLFLLLLYMF